MPIIALGVPIFDTLFTMVRRFLERRPLFSPDRGHIHHRLLDMGLTHRRAVLILYGVSVVFTAAAIAVSLGRSWQAGVALLGASVVLVGLVRFVGYFDYLHTPPRQRARIRRRDAELLRFLMPDLPALFAEAENEAEVWRAIHEVVQRSQLRFAELLPRAADPTAVTRWSNEEGQDPIGHELVRATYPVGREELARADLRFGWHSDYGDVSPQSEVLLQVVVDVVEAALRRVGSAYAPQTAVAVQAGAEAPRPSEKPAAANRASVA